MANMIMRNNNGVLVWDDGTPVFELGMMMVEILEHTANNNGYAWGYNTETNSWNINAPTVENVIKEFDLLVADGWRVIRARAIPASHPNKFRDSWGPASEYGTPSYWASVDATFDIMEQILDAAAERGIGIMFDIFGVKNSFPDYLFQADDTVRMTDWADPTSSLFTKAVEVAQRFVGRFANHPAISAWEVMGEWDGSAFYGNPPGVGSASQGWRQVYYRPEDVLTDDMLVTYQTNMVAAIREVDTTGRFIGSGTFAQKDIPRDKIFLDRWFKLNEMTDGASIHHYEGMPTGNRDYSAFKDTLILWRKKAFEKGLVSYIGEHGVLNDLTYAGLESDKRSDVEYDAIIESGTQLSFHWNWMGTPEGPEWTPSGRGVHTNAEWPSAKRQYQVLLDKLKKLRETEWKPANEMKLREFSYNLPTHGIATDRTNKYSFPIPRRQDGFTISFWWNPRSYAPWGQDVFVSFYDGPSTPLTETESAYRFPGGDNGIVIRSTVSGLDVGVRFTDSSFKSTSLIGLDNGGNTGDQVYGEDSWFHVVIQVINAPYTWDDSHTPGMYDAPGLTTFVNGHMKGYVAFQDAALQWQPPRVSNLIVGGLNEDYIEGLSNFMGRAKGGMADLRVFNRPLRHREVYDLYMDNRAPAGSMSRHWDFVDGSLTDRVFGVEGGMHTGASQPETITLPSSAWEVPYVYDYVQEDITMQLVRGDNITGSNEGGELRIKTDTNQIFHMDGSTWGVPLMPGTRSKGGNWRVRNNTIIGEDELPILEVGVALHNSVEYTYELNNNDTWFSDIEEINRKGVTHVLTTGLDFQYADAVANKTNFYAWLERFIDCVDWAYANNISLVVVPGVNMDQSSLSEYDRSAWMGLLIENIEYHPGVVAFTDELNVIHYHKSTDPQGAVVRDAIISDIHRSINKPVIAVIEANTESREAIDFQIEAATRTGVQCAFFSDWNTISSNDYYIDMIQRATDIVKLNKHVKRKPISIWQDEGLRAFTGSLTMTADPARWLDTHEGHHGLCTSFWVRAVTDTSGTQNIITRESNNYGYSIKAVNGNLEFTSHWRNPGMTGDQPQVFTDPVAISNDWDFYTVSADNDTSRIQVYRNGLLIHSQDMTGYTYTSPGTGDLIMGSTGYDLGQTTFYYRELESKEVNTIYVYDLIPARNVLANRWSSAVARFNYDTLNDSIGFVTKINGQQFIIDETKVIAPLTGTANYSTFVKPQFRKV